MTKSHSQIQKKIQSTQTYGEGGCVSKEKCRKRKFQSILVQVIQAQFALANCSDDDELSSKATINALVDEVQAVGGAIAFLSTPSIYFSLSDPTVRAARSVYRRKWILPDSSCSCFSNCQFPRWKLLQEVRRAICICDTQEKKSLRWLYRIVSPVTDVCNHVVFCAVVFLIWTLPFPVTPASWLSTSTRPRLFLSNYTDVLIWLARAYMYLFTSHEYIRGKPKYRTMSA